MLPGGFEEAPHAPLKVVFFQLSVVTRLENSIFFFMIPLQFFSLLYCFCIYIVTFYVIIRRYTYFL